MRVKSSVSVRVSLSVKARMRGKARVSMSLSVKASVRVKARVCMSLSVKASERAEDAPKEHECAKASVSVSLSVNLWVSPS